MTPVLAVDGLSVAYGRIVAVRDVSFQVQPGQGFGIVGESGSGKSTLARAILRLLPSYARVGGGVCLNGRSVYDLAPAELNRLRWRHVAVVFQNALSSLDPVYRVGDQIVEAIRAHRSLSRAAARCQAIELLQRTGVDGGFARCYPHQLSGGMRQRVAIAMAMALAPDLLLADEPTTALDAFTQAQVLAELMAMRAAAGSSLVLISHDIAVVNQVCDRLLVLYAGRAVELGPVGEVYRHAAHPYTIGLQRAVPRLEFRRLPVAIPGGLPPAGVPVPGCVFAPRCPLAGDVCRTESPPWRQVSAEHWAACHFSESAGPSIWNEGIA